MKTPAILCVMLLLSISVSCNRYSDSFAAAEALIDSVPDSALSILQSIDTGSMKSRSDKAKYSLLLSIAYDKNYIDLTSDSIARIAYDYYCTEQHGSDVDRMHSAYIMAVICNNNGNNLQGGRYAKEAECYGENSTDAYALGLLFRLQAEFAAKSRNNKQALSYIEKALSYFNKIENKDYRNYSLVNRAKYLSNSGEYVGSLKLLDSLYSKTDDVELHRQIKDAMIVPLTALSMKKQLKGIIIEKINSTDDVTAQEYSFLAKLYYDDEKVDSGDIYLHKSMDIMQDSYDSIAYYSSVIERYRITGDNDSIIRYYHLKNELIYEINSNEFDEKSQLISDQNDSVYIEHLKIEFQKEPHNNPHSGNIHHL